MKNHNKEDSSKQHLKYFNYRNACYTSSSTCSKPNFPFTKVVDYIDELQTILLDVL